MRLTCVIFVLCANILSGITYKPVEPGSEVIATRGAIWPMPKYIYTEYATLKISSSFKFKIIGHQCDILGQALPRYKKIIFQHFKPNLQSIRNHKDENNQNILHFLHINLKTTCNDSDRINDSSDESYELNIGLNNENFLEANEIWGILRGLESFSQLIYHADTDFTTTDTLILNYTLVKDQPRFFYRGLMLDTSRHFIPIEKILSILDGMVYNKFNVFHWHLVDDHAFPFKSEVFPELSEKGAYDPYFLIYTISEVKGIIEYARIRGIRVVVEIDTPGHTRSWGQSHPELLSKCIDEDKWTGQYGPFDPSVESLYPFLEKVFAEVFDIFPDKYLHIGADEIDYACWKHHPHLDDFIKENSLGNFTGLEHYYFQKLFDIIDQPDRKFIAWEELFFSNGHNLNKNIIYMTWIHGLQSAEKITRAGNKVIFSSSSWYLSQLLTGGDWEKLYKTDPHDIEGSDEQKALILGGTVCMWSENVDASNVLTRIWPRASAVAEKLWSPYEADSMYGAATRLEEHACRMIKRGIPTQPPNGPGYCLY